MDFSHNMASGLAWLSYVSLAMYIGPVTLVGIYWAWEQSATDSELTTEHHWYSGLLHSHRTHGAASAA